MAVQTDAHRGAWSSRHSWVLGAIVLLGLAWRLAVALHAPWYWDEGYVAELARALGLFTRPHVGGLWEDGFFPLSTSFLAPLTAAPFALAPWWSPMTGVRVWAVLLDCLALGTLVLLVRPRTHPRLALCAAACYAWMPFAAAFGGLAFYHHLAVVLMLATLGLGQDLFTAEASPRVALASLCAGLAVAACYWLWWLPFTLALILAWKRPKGWTWGLVWMSLPLLAALTVNFWPDPQGAWWSVQGMLRTSNGGGPRNAAAWLAAVSAVVQALPFLGIGLLGLGWAAFRCKGPWPWFLVCMAFAILEPLRQRGNNIASMPYPLLLAAPLAALGASVLAERALRRGPWRTRLAPALLCLAFFLPVNLAWMRLLSFTPQASAGLKAFLDKDGRTGDLVCGLPDFNWFLRPNFRDCEPSDVVAAEGHSAGFFVAGAPASRFAYPCRVDDIRYAVVSRVHILGLFRFEGVAMVFLQMERSGWRLVFDNKTFKVYENPRFGVKPDPAVRILEVPDYYRLARDQARQDGLPDLEHFAEERLR